jgi:hypothetical protein
MKASDSANSLTALYPDEPECFVCLDSNNDDKNEPVVHSSMLRTCGCKFMVHPTCWNEWMRDKTDYDCPICRKDTLVKFRGVPPNPVLTVVVQEEGRTWIQRNPTYFFCSTWFLICCILCVTVPLCMWLIAKN